MFKTTYESKNCECGGRCNSVPSTVAIHHRTQRHQRWEQWKMLCCRMLEDLSHQEKRQILKELKVLAVLV